MVWGIGQAMSSDLGSRSWVPAFAGMTGGDAGMTEGGTGMTEGDAGMTVSGRACGGERCGDGDVSAGYCNGSGGWSHFGESLTSMAVTHLTHSKPRFPGATSLTG